MIDETEVIYFCEYRCLSFCALRINHKLWIILYWLKLFAVDKYHFVKGFYLILINWCTWLFIIFNGYNCIQTELFYDDLCCDLNNTPLINLQYWLQESLKIVKDVFE